MFSTFRNPALVRIYVIPLLIMIIQNMSGAIGILFALELGADILQVNLITTIQGTMGILLIVPFGVLSDRYGRKPMVLFSRTITVLGTLIPALATTPNHLFIASFVGGFAGGGFFPVLLSMIGDVAKPHEQQEAISTLFLFSSIGMLVGPIICSFLLTLPQISLRSIYQIVTVAQIGALLYIVTQIQETKPQTSQKIRYRVYISGLTNQAIFRSLLLIVFLFFFSFSIINTYIPIYARVDMGLSNVQVASFSTYRNLGVMLIRLLSATFLTRVPVKPFLISVLALGGVVSVASSLTYNYLSIVTMLFLFGLSFGALRILSSSLVARNSTHENRGVANSLLNVSMSMGNIIKIVTSPVADNLGLTPVFILGGITSFSATLIALLRKKW